MHCDTGDGEDGERESDASRLVVVTGLSGSGISHRHQCLGGCGVLLCGQLTASAFAEIDATCSINSKV